MLIINGATGNSTHTGYLQAGTWRLLLDMPDDSAAAQITLKEKWSDGVNFMPIVRSDGSALALDSAEPGFVYESPGATLQATIGSYSTGTIYLRAIMLPRS